MVICFQLRSYVTYIATFLESAQPNYGLDIFGNSEPNERRYCSLLLRIRICNVVGYESCDGNAEDTMMYVYISRNVNGNDGGVDDNN